MYLVFVDESGSAFSSPERCLSRTKPMPDLFVLGALGIRESQLSLVNTWFADVKTGFLKARPATSLHPQAYEIKASVLYALRTGGVPDDWSHPLTRAVKRLYLAEQQAVWTGLSPTQLQGLELSLFDLIRRLRPTIWVVVVQQDSLYKRHGKKTWHPYYWAMTYLQQRIAAHVQTTFGSYERAAIIIDQNDNLKTARHFDSFLDVRDRINQTTAWPAKFDEYLVSVPLFGPSHLHQALQLPDMVSHAVWKAVLKRDSLRWLDQIDPFLARHWSTGKVDNAGLTFIR
jgi:hypothetical protein